MPIVKVVKKTAVVIATSVKRIHRFWLNLHKSKIAKSTRRIKYEEPIYVSFIPKIASRMFWEFI